MSEKPGTQPRQQPAGTHLMSELKFADPCSILASRIGVKD